MIDKKFEAAAIEYFKTEVGLGVSQRLDAIACFSPLTRFWFWKLRLEILVMRKIIQKQYINHSIFRNIDNIPFYGIKNK